MCYGMDGPISDVYEGDLLETPNGPVREGQGTLQRADGAVYEGSWQGGLMHGEGQLKYGETDRLDAYGGQFHKGMRHGVGTLTWSDGRKYTGQWKENQINGEGERVVWPHMPSPCALPSPPAVPLVRCSLLSVPWQAP